MSVASARPYANHLLQTDNQPAPHHSIFFILMPNQQCQSTEGNFASKQSKKISRIQTNYLFTFTEVYPYITVMLHYLTINLYNKKQQTFHNTGCHARRGSSDCNSENAVL